MKISDILSSASKYPWTSLELLAAGPRDKSIRIKGLVLLDDDFLSVTLQLTPRIPRYLAHK